MAQEPEQPVVIVGGGFAGAFCAYHLTEKAPRHARQPVVVISDDDDFVFKPLLPEAVGGASPPEYLKKSLTDLAEEWGFRFVRARAEAVDVAGARVLTDAESVSYGDLVLAVGSEVETHGIDVQHEGVFTLHTVPDSERLRAHVLRQVEKAAYAEDPDTQSQALHFLAVGCGPTGVETLCEIQELVGRAVKQATNGDLRSIQATFTIVEAGDEILPLLPQDLRSAVREQLERRGIAVELNSPVKRVEHGRCVLDDGRVFHADTILWSAGVRPAALVSDLDLPHDSQGKLQVDEYLRVRRQDHVWAAGDIACCTPPESDAPLPATAQVAVQEAKAVASNILRQAQGQPLEPFQYEQLGLLVTLGTGDAVGLLRGHHVEGVPGWLVSRAAYFARQLGFDNRMHLALGWAKHAFIETLLHPLWR